MDTLLSQAAEKGLHVVDSEKMKDSFEDFDMEVQEADELCSVLDKEDAPFESKYKARDKLDALCNKLEANRTVAMLDNNKSLVKELNWRIALLRVKLGVIGWECEEPHNAQIELDLAIVSH